MGPQPDRSDRMITGADPNYNSLLYGDDTGPLTGWQTKEEKRAHFIASASPRPPKKFETLSPEISSSSFVSEAKGLPFEPKSPPSLSQLKLLADRRACETLPP